MHKTVAVCSLIFLLLANGFCHADEDVQRFRRRTLEARQAFKPYDYGHIRVDGVISADTLRLQSGEKVKLIGVDTPHSKFTPGFTLYLRITGEKTDKLVRIFDQASKFVKELTLGKYVRLEFDKNKSAKNEGLLAYAYLSDGKMLNAEIIKEGYSRVLEVPPNLKHMGELYDAEREAKEAKRGLWSED